MERLSSKEFTYLQQYFVIEPFGAQRDNWHMAILASLYGTVHKRKGRSAPSMADFMYKDEKSREQKNNQSFLDFLSANAKPKVTHGDK
jgi:hypothetical protein